MDRSRKARIAHREEQHHQVEHILAHTSKTQQDVNCPLGQDAMGMICNLQMRAVRGTSFTV